MRAGVAYPGVAYPGAGVAYPGVAYPGVAYPGVAYPGAGVAYPGAGPRPERHAVADNVTASESLEPTAVTEGTLGCLQSLTCAWWAVCHATGRDSAAPRDGTSGWG